MKKKSLKITFICSFARSLRQMRGKDKNNFEYSKNHLKKSVMKRLIILWLLCTFGITTVWGEEEQAQYLFPEFENGQVLYRDGRVFNVQLNFSLVSNRFVFIDTFDENTIKEFAELDMVGSVKAGDRIFQISRRGEASEILQPENPLILVEYKGKIVDRGRKAAYGGRSQTSAVDSYSSFQSGGLTYKLKGDDRWIINGVEKKYRVEYKGKLKTFSTVKQFLNIYPKKQRPSLQEFIESKGIDFNSVEQVTGLCNYADSLN